MMETERHQHTKLAVVIKGPSFEEARRQIAENAEYADLLELRLDLFSELDLGRLARLSSSSVPKIFTLRSRLHGGGWNFSEEERLETLFLLAGLRPQFLDLEISVPKPFLEKLTRRYPEIQLILSHHDFLGIPQNLDRLLEEMRKSGASFYKIAVAPKSSSEALRFLLFAKEKNDGKLVPIAMGPHGQAGRILAPLVGTPITYASCKEGEESAPGQLSAKSLKEMHRYDFLASEKEVAIYGLIGDPLTASISDIIHNRFFETLSSEQRHSRGIYLKMRVGSDELKEFLQLAKKLPLKGVSVTMPHKESIIPHLAAIDQEALAMGAVNTLLFREGRIEGFNTDGKGALAAIEKRGPIAQKRVVILGAGGAARAIAFAAGQKGAQVVLAGRDEKKTKACAKQLGCRGAGFDQLKGLFAEGYDLLINCTPSQMPIPSDLILPKTLVMDIQILPVETEFLLAAQKKGCPVIFGFEMFLEQAALQHAIWSGSANTSEEFFQLLQCALFHSMDTRKRKFPIPCSLEQA